MLDRAQIHIWITNDLIAEQFDFIFSWYLRALRIRVTLTIILRIGIASSTARSTGRYFGA
jgi:hypothetical protein